MAFKKDKYPPDWTYRIRPAILKRDGYKCAFCGVSNHKIGYRDENLNFIECDEFLRNWALKNGKKVFKIHLAVMHMDHDTTNNDFANLKSGCQLHHNRHDAKHRAFNRLKSKAISALLLMFSLSFLNPTIAQVCDWSKISNFHLHEFDCSCEKGSGSLMKHEFMRRLDMARELSGIPFIITSGFRHVEHNKSIGGVSNSPHLLGVAADIWCIDPQLRWEIIKACQAVGLKRFGIYSTHIHVDHDTTKKPSIMWLECR